VAFGMGVWLLPAAIGVAAKDQTVSIVDLAFKPATLTVDQGDVVTWTNDGATDHTVTSDDGTVDSGSLSPSDRFANLFDVPGVYTYHCAIHPSKMKGTITVRAVAQALAPSDDPPPAGTRPPGPPTPTVSVEPSPVDAPFAGSGVAFLVILVVIAVVAGAVYYGRRRSFR